MDPAPVVADAVEFLHRGDHIVEVLQHVVEVDFVGHAVLEGERVPIQIVHDIDTGERAVDADGAGVAWTITSSRSRIMPSPP